VLRSFDDLKYYRLRLSLIMIPVACAALYGGIHAAGLIGAITTWIAVQTFDLSILIRALARKLNISFRDIRRLTSVLRTVGATTAAALATVAIKLLIASAHVFVVLVVSSTVFVAVFLAAAWIIGAITVSEKAEMRGALLKVYRVGSTRLGLSTAAEIQEQQAG
jgi:hypothetical protein